MPVVLLRASDGLPHRDGVADLDRRGQRRLRRDRLEVPVALVGQVAAGWPPRLRDDDARPLADDAERFEHVEAGAERADVAEIAARDDHDVGHLPVELLDDLDGDRLLAFEPQAVHRVGQVHALLAAQAACTMAMQPSKSVSSDSTSAPLASGCTSCAVVTLPFGQDDDGRDARGGRVGGQRRGGVAGRRAGDGLHRAAVGHHLLDHRDQHGHARGP